MVDVQAEDVVKLGKILKPRYTGTVAQIMKLGGFKLKYMIRNGEKRPEILSLYGGSVLGLPWDTNQDVIKLFMKVNLSAKKQGVCILRTKTRSSTLC